MAYIANLTQSGSIALGSSDSCTADDMDVYVLSTKYDVCEELVMCGSFAVSYVLTANDGGHYPWHDREWRNEHYVELEDASLSWSALVGMSEYSARKPRPFAYCVDQERKDCTKEVIEVLEDCILCAEDVLLV
ncbi:hypothetical protein Tco_1532108 [Tanacetum coccineum]